MIKLLEMFGIHKNIVRSTEKGGDDPLWVRERRVRECVMMKVYGTSSAASQMWQMPGWNSGLALVLDKGPAKSQCHKGHSRGPCPTASSMMFQLLSVLQ